MTLPSDTLHPTLPRRTFLRNSILLALPVIAAAGPAAAAVAMAAPAARAASAFVPPRRARGTRVVNVRDFGARGNGSRDDTTSFQNAVDALPAAGGTVQVPAGNYVIDPVRSVHLRSKMHMQLASGAVLRAKRNAEDWTAVLTVLRVSEVEISGGEIIGDRDNHIGTTGEWGHGIMVRGGSNVTIRDVLARKCWGDGIYIGQSFRSGSIAPRLSSNVVVSNVACIQNRRQGMSIGQCNNVKVYDSEFAHTNGLAPGCGIDIEPDVNMSGTSTRVHIENCSIHHNQGNGIQVYKDCRETTIKGCRIDFNSGYGVLAIGAKVGTVSQNHFTSNKLNGIGIRSGSGNYAMGGNHFYNNARQFRSKDLARISPPRSRSGQYHERHTQIAASSAIAINSNLYYD